MKEMNHLALFIFGISEGPWMLVWIREKGTREILITAGKDTSWCLTSSTDSQCKKPISILLRKLRNIKFTKANEGWPSLQGSSYILLIALLDKPLLKEVRDNLYLVSLLGILLVLSK